MNAAAERHRVIHYEIMLRIRLMRANRDLRSARRWWAAEMRALAAEAVTLSAGYSRDVMERARLLQKQAQAAAADCHHTARHRPGSA